MLSALCKGPVSILFPSRLQLPQENSVLYGGASSRAMRKPHARHYSIHERFILIYYFLHSVLKFAKRWFYSFSVFTLLRRMFLRLAVMTHFLHFLTATLLQRFHCFCSTTFAIFSGNFIIYLPKCFIFLVKEIIWSFIVFQYCTFPLTSLVKMPCTMVPA